MIRILLILLLFFSMSYCNNEKEELCKKNLNKNAIFFGLIIDNFRKSSDRSNDEVRKKEARDFENYLILVLYQMKLNCDFDKNLIKL